MELSFEEWTAKIEEYIVTYRINKKLEEAGSLISYWKEGYTPVAMIRHLFPDYWRF